MNVFVDVLGTPVYPMQRRTESRPSRLIECWKRHAGAHGRDRFPWNGRGVYWESEIVIEVSCCPTCTLTDRTHPGLCPCAHDSECTLEAS